MCWEAIIPAVMNAANEVYEQKMLLTLTPQQRASYLADKLEKRRIKAIEDLAESNRALARAQIAQADAFRYHTHSCGSNPSSTGVDLPTVIALDLMFKNL